MIDHDIRFVPIDLIEQNAFNPWKYIAGLMLTEYLHRMVDKSVKYCARDFELLDKIRILNQRGVYVGTKTKNLSIEQIGESELKDFILPDIRINQLTDPGKMNINRFGDLQEDFSKNHLEEALRDLITLAEKHSVNKIKTGSSVVP